MSCEGKKRFETAKEAGDRTNQINHENKKNKKKNPPLRSYKCDECGGYHLSSMNKHKYKMVNDVKYRNKIHEERFIEREAEYWEKKFGIDK